MPWVLDFSSTNYTQNLKSLYQNQSWVLLNSKGNTQSNIYFEEKKQNYLLGNEFRISCEDNTIDQLVSLLGRENVVLK